MNDILYAFYMTMELWIFLGLLGLFMVGEEFVRFMKARNEQHQQRINAEIDRLHR
jgi:hypothetical protein